MVERIGVIAMIFAAVFFAMFLVSFFVFVAVDFAYGDYEYGTPEYNDATRLEFKLMRLPPLFIICSLASMFVVICCKVCDESKVH